MNSEKTTVSYKTFLDSIFVVACVAILVFYVPLTILANSDLTAGRFALYMDERITFDGVKQILHPNGLMYFFDSVFNGGDHRYGRSLWNSIAIFSVIPERLFGDSGQIIAARMLQVVLVVASYCIFAFGILRSWFLRFVLLVVMLTIPFSDYFMTMPKPEPLQLFFLSLFIFYFFKTNAALSWYWIFIGLAFGTKISTLPALLVFIGVSLVAKSKNELPSHYRKTLLNAAMAFFLGLAIAVPILFGPFLLSIAGYIAFYWLIKRLSFGRISRITIAATVVVTILFTSRRYLKVWVSSTFLNTTQSADNPSTNALSWLDYFFDVWLIAPYVIGLMLSALILLYLFIYVAQILNSDSFAIDQRVTAVTIAVAGLALNIAIITGVKRLWGFYLYTGSMLMIIGIIVMADLSISAAIKTNKKQFAKINKYLGYIIAIFSLLVSGFYWMPHAIDGFKSASLRTRTPEYSLQYSSYTMFVDFLDNYKAPEGKRLRVMFTPSLFPPESNKKYAIVEFWGPYIKWNEEPDIIIFGIENTPRGTPTPESSPSYNAFLIEREGYAAHVAEKGKACKSKPCFIRELNLPNGGEVLVLSKPD